MKAPKTKSAAQARARKKPAANPNATLAGRVAKLPYKPEGFTITQLRKAVRAAHKDRQTGIETA